MCTVCLCMSIYLCPAVFVHVRGYIRIGILTARIDTDATVCVFMLARASVFCRSDDERPIALLSK